LTVWWRPKTWPADVRWAATLMVVVATVGGLATDVGPWYQSLAQPAWKPPDAWFGPVWSTLYVSTAWAGIRTWRRLPEGQTRRFFLAACLLNALLNILWSVLYFAARRPDWALIEAAVLWCSAAWVTYLMSRVDRVAVMLMLPHLTWLGLAWALNQATVSLNPIWGG